MLYGTIFKQGLVIKMLVAVILGNRLNDDGSITEIMETRLKSALKINGLFSPEYIIVSGGVANVKAGVSEAQTMGDYLIARGVPSDKIVLEDKSLTTKQNAEFSLPICAKLNATELLLCTSLEHMSRKHLNPIKLFQKELTKYPDIKLSIFSE